MGRAPCCDKANVKNGPWSPEEDAKLKDYIEKHGTGGNWIALPQKAGLRRCGKSCRLRWLNYLRPNIKHGEFSNDEDKIICTLFASIGSRWSIIAAQLPGRTDNDIKNYWNTKLKKKLLGVDPSSASRKRPHQATTYSPVSLFQSQISSSSPYPSFSSPTLSSTSSAYECSTNNYYTIPVARSFTGCYNTINSLPSSFMTTACSPNASATTVLQDQDDRGGPMRNYQTKDRLITFGGDQTSCSSSGGSCSYQISHCKDVEDDYGPTNVENIGFQSFYHGVVENQKFMHSGGVNFTGYGDDEKPADLAYGEDSFDYSLEGIKQLVSTNICNNLNFFDVENKTEEKVMMYF